MGRALLVGGYAATGYTDSWDYIKAFGYEGFVGGSTVGWCRDWGMVDTSGLFRSYWSQQNA